MGKYIEKEKNFIFQNCKKMTVQEMAKKISRSVNSIRAFMRHNRLEYKSCRNSYSQELTDREKEVMELLSQAYTLEAIAQILCISLATVKTHLGNIRNKYGICKEKDRNMIVYTIAKYKEMEGIK